METGQACISKYSNGLHNETTCSKVLVPRIKVVLGPSTSASCPEFSFKHLLQKETAKAFDVDCTLAEDSCFGDVAKLAKRLEEKYGPKSGKKHKLKYADEVYQDLAEGYDENDPFIDNTEAYDEFLPRDVTTKHGGFYVNRGALDFRCISDQDDSGGDFTPVAKKKLQKSETCGEEFDGHCEDIAKKKFKKKRLQLTTAEDRDVNSSLAVYDTDHLAIRRKKPANPDRRRKSIGIKKPMKQPDVACVTVDPLDGADFPPCASNNDDVPSVLSSIPQTSAPPSGKDVDATAASCPVPADREDDDNKMEAQCTLPSDLPSGLNAAILDLKQAAKDAKGGKCKFFSGHVNNLLLDIELGSRHLGFGKRSSVYSHLAQHLPCGKETLIKRAKKLCQSQQKNPIHSLLEQLKQEIDSVMPSLREQHEVDVARFSVVYNRLSNRERLDSGGGAAKEDAANTESDEEDRAAAVLSGVDGSSRRGNRDPRKKFKWTPEIRVLLGQVVQLKMCQFTSFRSHNRTAEEFLRVFLDTDVRVLWPQGWMQTRMLYKETRSVHRTWTSVKRKLLITPPTTITTMPSSSTTATNTAHNQHHTVCTDANYTSKPDVTMSPDFKMDAVLFKGTVEAATSSVTVSQVDRQPNTQVVTSPAFTKQQDKPAFNMNISPHLPIKDIDIVSDLNIPTSVAEELDLLLAARPQCRSDIYVACSRIRQSHDSDLVAPATASGRALTAIAGVFVTETEKHAHSVSEICHKSQIKPGLPNVSLDLSSPAVKLPSPNRNFFHDNFMCSTSVADLHQLTGHAKPISSPVNRSATSTVSPLPAHHQHSPSSVMVTVPSPAHRNTSTYKSTNVALAPDSNQHGDIDVRLRKCHNSVSADTASKIAWQCDHVGKGVKLDTEVHFGNRCSSRTHLQQPNTGLSRRFDLTASCSISASHSGQGNAVNRSRSDVDTPRQVMASHQPTSQVWHKTSIQSASVRENQAVSDSYMHVPFHAASQAVFDASRYVYNQLSQADTFVSPPTLPTAARQHPGLVTSKAKRSNGTHAGCCVRVTSSNAKCTEYAIVSKPSCRSNLPLPSYPPASSPHVITSPVSLKITPPLRNKPMHYIYSSEPTAPFNDSVTFLSPPDRSIHLATVSGYDIPNRGTGKGNSLPGPITGCSIVSPSRYMALTLPCSASYRAITSSASSKPKTSPISLLKLCVSERKTGVNLHGPHVPSATDKTNIKPHACGSTPASMIISSRMSSDLIINQCCESSLINSFPNRRLVTNQRHVPLMSTFAPDKSLVVNKQFQNHPKSISHYQKSIVAGSNDHMSVNPRCISVNVIPLFNQRLKTPTARKQDQNLLPHEQMLSNRGIICNQIHSQMLPGKPPPRKKAAPSAEAVAPCMVQGEQYGACDQPQATVPSHTPRSLQSHFRMSL